MFAETIREIRQRVPDYRVEVLIPDFQGLEEPLRMVMDAKPDILNHNTETVPRLYRVARQRTLRALAASCCDYAKEVSPKLDPDESPGVMVGTGRGAATKCGDVSCGTWPRVAARIS